MYLFKYTFMSYLVSSLFYPGNQFETHTKSMV